jgi:hypothetical protein
MNCPRCGAFLERPARFCINCGQPIAPLDVVRPEQNVETLPSKPAGSVLRLLLPARMPKGSFWAGLALVLAGAVFALCTSATSMALLLGSGAGVEGLLVSACGLGLLAVPGLALLLAGRPRTGP